MVTKDEIISAKRFSNCVINGKVIDRIIEESDKTGVKKVDLMNFDILRYTHEIIAKAIVDHGLEVINIKTGEDVDLIDYYRRKLNQPKVRDYKDFEEMFKARFRKGAICILDRTLHTKSIRNESKRSVIQIEEVKGHRVMVKQFKSAFMQPALLQKGLETGEAFYLTEFRLIDIYDGSISIEFPKDERERKIIDLLFGL